MALLGGASVASVTSPIPSLKQIAGSMDTNGSMAGGLMVEKSRRPILGHSPAVLTSPRSLSPLTRIILLLSTGKSGSIVQKKGEERLYLVQARNSLKGGTTFTFRSAANICVKRSMIVALWQTGADPLHAYYLGIACDNHGHRIGSG